MTDAFTLVIAVVVFGWLVVEARRASRNERMQFARGGVEPEGDVYAVMRLAYPGVFLAMIVESAVVAQPRSMPLLIAGAVLFALAKALKWWAIVTLGPCWTFRVVVVPGTARIVGGPYRVLAHPNYVAVIGELVGVAMLTAARVTGPISVVAFSALIVRRVSVENHALSAILPRS